MHCFCKKVKSYHCKIILLDEQELIKEIQDNSRGQEVLDTVFTHLNLIETAYFGLRYLDGSNQTFLSPGLVMACETVTASEEIARTFGENPIKGRHWLDPAKKIVKQLKGTDPFSLYFGVKFYAADPCKLLEEITRYQFFLQVKQDILQGRLPVTFDVAAELGAYVVQSPGSTEKLKKTKDPGMSAELGDYDPRRHSPGYVSEFRLTSNQSAELESRIEELHKGLIGQLPAAAELSYLEKVKWLEMYGVDLHPVLGEDNVEYFLGLTPSGIIVLRNKNKVGHYYWPRISKIYFKGRYFMIRICDKNNEENTYGFETPSKPACKHLWKCCVEHHAFFRLVQVSPTSPDIFTLGSRFRYSGRTEKQAQADAQMRLRSPPNFCRTPSRRYQRRRVEGAPDVPKISELENRENIPPQEMKMVSIPQPVVSVAGVYRSTSSIPAVLQSQGRNESPRSTRSAPWSQPGHVRGLYNSTTSPRSVRSAGQVQCSSHLMPKMTQRSSSVDSQSSNDSRSCKRRHRSRKSSDNESELSKCSNRSHHWQRRRSQSKRDSDSEKDHHHHHHHHHRHRHKSGSSSRRRQSSRYELVDSEAQWKEVQKRQAEGSTGVHHATVISNKDRRSGYMNSGMETESEMSYHRKRKQKKHRSRSRSPSDGGKGRLPDELKKHLEFKLIDTEGMSESQLREIPYKVVETSAGKSHRKYSPNSKRKNNAGNNRKQKRTPSEEDNAKVSNENQASQMSNHLSEGSRNKNANVNVSSGDSGHFSNTGPGSNSSTISNSAFADFLNKNRNGLMPSNHATQDQVPSRNCQLLPRNSSASDNNYVKTPGQKTHGSYLTANAISLPKKNTDKVQCLHTSALYGNPTTLLGNLNEINQNGRFSNGKNSTANMKNETDDSGLSVDSQEQTYLKTVRSFKQIQGQAREGAVNPSLRSEFRNQNMDDPDSLQDNNHHYVDFDGGFYSTVNFINNNSITKTCLTDAIGTTRSDGIINQKKLRGPLYVQSRSSSRYGQNVPGGNLDSGLEKRRSASLEFILSPIIKSTYQPSALE